jgi:hypothetical protein
MQKDETVQKDKQKPKSIIKIKQELEPQIRVGDWVLLGNLLKIESSTARMRFLRDKENAVFAMKKMIDNRNEFTESFHNKEVATTA